MLDLSKTTDAVKEELENDLYLLEILKDDLINVQALARKLLPKIQRKNPKANVASISIAAKRYVDALKKQKMSQIVAEIIAHSQLSTKNDIMHLTFQRNNEVMQRVSVISKQIRWDDDEIFFVNQGSGEVTIILDKKNAPKLDDCKKYKIEATDNIAIISIKENLKKEHDRSIDVPGIYSYFLSRLARRSITVIALVSTYTQLTLAFKKNDFIRAYETLETAIAYFRDSCKKEGKKV